MKKIFTLVCMALAAMSVNAQTESYATVVDGAFAPEFVNATLADGKLTATITTANTEVFAVAGTTPKGVEGSGAQYIEPDGTVTQWADPVFNGPKNHGDTGFSWVEGSGNPFVGISAEEIVTEGEPTGTYRAVYEYYSPDGSKGLPLTGFYVEFTAKVAGKFSVKFWNNKGGSRELYIVDEDTKAALTPNVDYTAKGYVNGQKDTDGNMILFDPFPIGTPDAPYLIDPDHANGAVRLGWLEFNVQANKKYMVFGKDWQFGFAGYDFTPNSSDGISTVKATQNADAPIYNLAGQKVGKDFKGVKIQNGKKFM